MGTIRGPAYFAALSLINSVRAEFSVPPMTDLPHSTTRSTSSCAIAEGLKACSKTGTINVAGIEVVDPATGKATRGFSISDPIGYPPGTKIVRPLPEDCIEFIQQFDALSRPSNEHTKVIPADHVPEQDLYMGRLPVAGSAKANACGCVLCVPNANAKPTLEQMVDAIALHGRPGSEAAKGALFLPENVDVIEVRVPQVQQPAESTAELV